MGAEAYNAISAALSAIAAIFAVAIGALSVRELRRVDERARRREANQRDESLQIRLESMYPDLYKIFGTPSDRIPTEIRPPIISFFGLYADVFTAKRDNLLPKQDADTFLEEFDWWVGSENGRIAWTHLRDQSWPAGFAHHVDAATASTRPYSSLSNKSAGVALGIKTPGMLELVPSPSTALLRSAAWTLLSLRKAGNSEFPPSVLDRAAGDDLEVQDRTATLLTAYSNWLSTSDTPIWAQWVASINGRAVGHVCVCEPHEYLGKTDVTSTGQGILEISRLFVDPRLQGMGVGRTLLQCAVTFIDDFGCTPALAVLEDSTAARTMYQHGGWVECGRFDGVQGLNILMTRSGS